MPSLPSAPAPPGTQAVVRAVRLLKALAATRAGSTLQALADSQGLSKPTAHRILAALESEGLVARDPESRRFRLGSAAVTLSLQAEDQIDLRPVARPTLERLAEQSGETATLEVCVGDEMLILDEVPGRHLVAAQAEVGTRWPLHATSTGKAILAALSSEDLRRRLSQPRSRFTPATLVDEQDLLDDLRLTRDRGWSLACEELEPGYCAVGAACGSAPGRLVAALSLGGPRERILAQAPVLGRLVFGAVQELSGRLR